MDLLNQNNKKIQKNTTNYGNNDSEIKLEPIKIITTASVVAIKV